MISRRINPYSPNSHLLGFYSLTKLSPSNQLNVIIENDPETAKAFCVVINSIVFLSQFFLLKEESTGRYIDIRFYDLAQMIIFPNKNIIKKLNTIFNDKKSKIFPSLGEQLDSEFDARYRAFWLKNRKKQKTLFEMNEIVIPSKKRLDFDRTVCNALGLNLSDDEILKLYTVIVNEMIITKGLKRE